MKTLYLVVARGWPSLEKAADSRSALVGVRGFKSLPSHNRLLSWTNNDH